MMKSSVVSVSSLILILLVIAAADTLIPVEFGTEKKRNDQVQLQDVSCLTASVETRRHSYCDSGEENFPLFISNTTIESASLYVMVRSINESAYAAPTRNSNILFDPKTVEVCIEYVALAEVSNASPRVCGSFVEDGTILRMDLPTPSSSTLPSEANQTEGAHVLHAWAQAESPLPASADGVLIRGKYGSRRPSELRHLCSSDVYVTLDFSLPASGLVMHYGSVGLAVQENVCVAALDAVAVDGNPSPSSSSSYNTTIRGVLSHPYSLQRLAADFCATHRLTSASCGRLITRLSVSLHKRHLADVLGLPSVQHMPSPQDPYVFLHIEKNAGTALRYFANESAAKHELGVFIPCFRDVNCMTFSLFVEGDDDDKSLNRNLAGGVGTGGKSRRDFRNVSVLAGHFSWDIWRDLEITRGDISTRDSHSIQGEGNKNEDAGKAGCVVFAADGSCLLHPTPVTAETSTTTPSKTEDSTPQLPPQRKKGSCFVVGRHPIDRVLAYYYQRCFKNKGCLGYGRYFNDLSVQELIEIENTFRDIGSRRPLVDPTTQIMDDGISDAGCRTLIEGQSLRGVTLEAEDGIAYLPPLPGPLSDEAISEALRNVGECVVAVFEDWESTAEEIINHWFPWMEFQRMTFVRKTLEKLDHSRAMEVRSELMDAVMMMNKCDLLLYDKMRRMSKAQLEVIRSNAFKA